jgi:hypothetical protein
VSRSLKPALLDKRVPVAKGYPASNDYVIESCLGEETSLIRHIGMWGRRNDATKNEGWQSPKPFWGESGHQEPADKIVGRDRHGFSAPGTSIR